MFTILLFHSTTPRVVTYMDHYGPFPTVRSAEVWLSSPIINPNGDRGVILEGEASDLRACGSIPPLPPHYKPHILVIDSLRQPHREILSRAPRLIGPFGSLDAALEWAEAFNEEAEGNDDPGQATVCMLPAGAELRAESGVDFEASPRG
jgi:hypothetical protein